MYCRNCGALVNDRADICLKCGCRPLNGDAYCQECGAETTEKQELCIKCGCRLKKMAGNSTGAMDGVNHALDTVNRVFDGGTVSDTDMNLNLNFSLLSPYYQREFQKIYESGEIYKGKFNICAFLFGAIWALTKGCWLSVIIALVTTFLTSGFCGFIWWFIYAFRGTYMYYCAYVKGKQNIV